MNEEATETQQEAPEPTAAEAEGDRLSEVFAEIEGRQTNRTGWSGQGSRPDAPRTPEPEPSAPESTSTVEETIQKARRAVEAAGLDPDQDYLRSDADFEARQFVDDTRIEQAAAAAAEAIYGDEPDPATVDYYLRQLEHDPARLGELVQEWADVDPYAANQWALNRHSELQVDEYRVQAELQQQAQQEYERLVQGIADRGLDQLKTLKDRHGIDTSAEEFELMGAIADQVAEVNPLEEGLSETEQQQRWEILRRSVGAYNQAMAVRDANIADLNRRHAAFDNRGQWLADSQIAAMGAAFGATVDDKGQWHPDPAWLPDADEMAGQIRPRETPEENTARIFSREKPKRPSLQEEIRRVKGHPVGGTPRSPKAGWDAKHQQADDESDRFWDLVAQRPSAEPWWTT